MLINKLCISNAKSPFKRRDLILHAFVALAFLYSTVSMANQNQWIEQGKGSFRWYGLKIYDVRMMVKPSFTGDYLKDRPMVLEFTYDINIDKNDLVDTTLDEINKLAIGKSAQCNNKQIWAAELRTIWPNLKQGDILKYEINFDHSSNFYHNQKPIGSISDRNFSNCFASIWLASDSSAKTLRKKLLGL